MTSQKILGLIEKNPEITISTLSSEVGVSDRAVKYQLENLKSLGKLRRKGSAKGGHWEIL